MKNYVITFENTHTSMEGESVLKEKGIKLIIIPTPTYITKSCGISIRIDEQDYEDVKKIIESKEINIKNVYLKEGKDYQLVM
ncbi:DUF3343 domain-containing protein [Clostridium botulinum]|uniref:Putative Se/S carrier protein-like domain-containing protein n=1 Tax=Clostridium botulinum (strain Okra / Type B1) TaxID=498213 RepID=B1IHQ8_CLOBK|nr:DUF3343 domain-containing protein [Clostridium botulinum]ACA43602.1 conserved hypothetical protein [Clostridium botulinum B1 str. Okra]MBD5564222.1 DUF3343 domain-containing protein [Clostridium botulinum]MBD5568458.1 DUF3343 domain-containing protein [Clostridium botulinum]MBD5572189.1 DUF3343 domain-containing protein [Clostridium botulinum]MBD5575880.1 DUF3343 domain-containing protein [Clostridium botulinum]